MAEDLGAASEVGVLCLIRLRERDVVYLDAKIASAIQHLTIQRLSPRILACGVTHPSEMPGLSLRCGGRYPAHRELVDQGRRS